MHDADRSILTHATEVRKVTIDLVGRIPEEWLDRTAEGEKEPLRQLLLHIAAGQAAYMENVARDGKGFVDDQAKVDREGIIRALAETDQRMLDFFQTDDGVRMGQIHTHVRRGTRHIGRDSVLYLTGHEEHHRGKIVLALRQWGLGDIPFMPRKLASKE